MKIGRDAGGTTTLCNNTHMHIKIHIEIGFTGLFFSKYIVVSCHRKSNVLTKYTLYIYAFQLDTYEWLAKISLRHLYRTYSPSSRSNSNRHFLANCGFREWAWNHLFHGICQESNISDACCAPCQNKPSQNHIMTCVSPCFRLSDPGYPYSPFRVCH